MEKPQQPATNAGFLTGLVFLWRVLFLRPLPALICGFCERRRYIMLSKRATVKSKTQQGKKFEIWTCSHKSEKRFLHLFIKSSVNLAVVAGHYMLWFFASCEQWLLPKGTCFWKLLCFWVLANLIRFSIFELQLDQLCKCDWVSSFH